MHIFWERGYEGASMASLTAAMGVSSPSLYAAFGGKEALFREAVTLYAETAGGRTRQALREQPTARQAIEAMLRDNVLEYTADDHPRGCMVTSAAANYTPANRGVHDYLAGMRWTNFGIILERLRRGVEEGDVPAGTDISAMARFYTTMLYGLAAQARDGMSSDELDSVIDGAMASWKHYTDSEGVAPT